MMDATDGPLGSRPDFLACERCGASLTRGRGESYLVEIRAVADPSPPVFSEEELEADVERAIGELLGRIRAYSSDQLLDQVYARRLHALCSVCYARWIADPFGGEGRHSRSRT